MCYGIPGLPRLVIGFLLASFLAKEASVTYLDIVRINYLVEKQRLATEAVKNHDWDSAIVHYSSMVETSHQPTLQSFDPRYSTWSFWLPLASPMLKLIANQTDRDGALAKGVATEEALNRAKLAVSLESAGQSQKADEEYKASMKQLGYSDIAMVRDLGRRLIENSGQR